MAEEANWYHAHIDAVSRGEGKTFTGLASYMTGESLKDERTGTWCTRNHEGDVLSWGIEAPKPAAWVDEKELGKLANAVEKSETRINSHVGNHWNLASSREFSEADHIAVAKTMAKELSARYGVLVIWAVHKPTEQGKDSNWHIHLGYNMRRLDAKGFGEKAREIIDRKTSVVETIWQRKLFADQLNKRLALIGSVERVSHLSYKDRGIDREPMKHLGHKANQLELKGQATEIGDFNRAVREREKQLDAQVAARDATIRTLEAEIHNITIERLKRPGARQMDFTPQAEALAEQQKENIEAIKLNRELQDNYIKEWEERRRSYSADTEKDEVRKHDDINDAAARWDKASSEARGNDPWLAMSNAVEAEKVQFIKDQKELRVMADNEDDPEKKKFIDLRRQIEACDYMAMGHERNASLSRYNTGRVGAGDADEQQKNDWAERGAELRQERRDLERGDKAQEREDKSVEKGDHYAELSDKDFAIVQAAEAKRQQSNQESNEASRSTGNSR